MTILNYAVHAMQVVNSLTYIAGFSNFEIWASFSIVWLALCKEDSR